MSRIRIAGLALGALALLHGFAAQAAPAAWTQWLQQLRSSGYTVSQGSASVQNCSTSVAVFYTCAGNNPSGAYIQTEPPVDGEYIDPCYNAAHDCSGATPNALTRTVQFSDGSSASVNPYFRLVDTQAIVTLIQLPPAAAYLGLQSYVFTRNRSDCNAPAFPDPCRSPIFGSVGNAINNVSIARQSGLALGSGGTVAIVTTSNAALYNALASALSAAGIDASKQLFAEPLAQHIRTPSYDANVRTGLGSEADELATLLRYSLPADASGTSWMNDLPNQVQVFRVTAPASLAVSRYDTVRIQEKRVNVDETTSALNYSAALDELQTLLANWLVAQKKIAGKTFKVPVVSSTTMATQSDGSAIADGLLVGPVCISRGLNCLGDTQDTDTYRTAVVGPLLHTAMMIGVDSTRTGNATYHAVSVYRNDTLEGVAAISQTNPSAAGFDTRTLHGSASDFIALLQKSNPQIQPSATLAAALPDLYIALVTRECTRVLIKTTVPEFCNRPYVMKLSSKMTPAPIPLTIAHRAYVRPGDINGADPTRLLTPRVVY